MGMITKSRSERPGSNRTSTMELSAWSKKRSAREELQSQKPQRFLSKIVTRRSFMLAMLLISVVDCLLVATELTADILGIVTERKALCDTDQILQHLRDDYPGRLDEYFQSHSIDDIVEDIVSRDLGDHSVLRYKRDLLGDLLTVDGRQSTTQPASPGSNTTDRSNQGGNTTQRSNQQQSTTQRAKLPQSTTQRTNQRGSTKQRGSATTTSSTTHHGRPGFPGSVQTSAPESKAANDLLETSRVFGSISAFIIIFVFLIKLLTVSTLRKKFFRSKLQVIDAAVVVISVPIDIMFLPFVWDYEHAMNTALPILFHVLTRVIRVIINSLINLHEQEKELLAQESDKLQDSVKRYRTMKRHVNRLRELARDHEAEEGQILACTKIVKTKRWKLTKTSTTKGIMSVNKLLFLAAPALYPEPNQFLKEEREEEKEAGVSTKTATRPTQLTIVENPTRFTDSKIRFNTASPSSSFSPRVSMASYGSEEDDIDLGDDETNYSINGMDTDSEDDLDSLEGLDNIAVTYM